MGESKNKPDQASASSTPSPSSSPSSTPRASTSSPVAPPPPPPPEKPRLKQQSTLVQPPKKKNKAKGLRVFRSVFRSLPIMTPVCTISASPVSLSPDPHRHITGTRVTGTLFGYRKGRVSLSIQENNRCLPTLVIELAVQTNLLLKELNAGIVRVALECEKKNDKTRLLDEPMWTMYCNGKKSGYALRREPTNEDLNVMEVLNVISMGAGVLPGSDEPDDELAYMRAHFDWVVGSKDSETFYMMGLSPDTSNGPELSVFFVRV